MKALLFRTVAMLVLATAARSQTALAVTGQPYFSGSMTLSIVSPANPNKPALLLLGLNPLPVDSPLYTSKGPLYVGNLLNVLGIGATNATGTLLLPFTMPPTNPLVIGIPVVVQGYLNGALTNPATIPLDEPYALPANITEIKNPAPTQQARFGDQVAAGDLNGDGVVDLAVGAWFEKVNGKAQAGKVYVMWGPAFTSFTVLQAALPKEWATFGARVLINDTDMDGFPDLLVGAPASGDPPLPEHGNMFVYSGGPSFGTVPARQAQSLGIGVEAAGWGRVAAIGDFNDDGAPDIAVGVSNATIAALPQAGRLEVFWGPSYSTMVVVDNPTPHALDFFGSSLSVADVTGDGVDDIVEGSGRANSATANQVGRIHVYAGPLLSLFAVIENPLSLPLDRFGETVFSTDLNDDGLPDIVASDVHNRLFFFAAPHFTSYEVHTKPPTAYTNAFGETAFGYFIQASHLNADRYEDLIVADPFEGTKQGCSPLSAEGAIFGLLGPYYATFNYITSPFPACGDEFSWGQIVVDIDHDGAEELILGAPTRDVGVLSNTGSVFILRP
ncbi:MAG: hypothetical protein ABI624_06685 [Casimicrobiaceae bacterium]